MIRKVFARGLPLFAALMLSLSGVQAAEDALVFSAAPTHTTEVTQELYGPLIKYLSQVTGQKIVIKPARNYLEYTNKMREGEYDILFDGPHFVGWRQEMLGHKPLVRLPGQIKIVVVVPQSSQLTDIRQLSGKKVCSFASPNMLTMAFLQQFSNPVRQPVMVSADGFKGLVECLLGGDVDAAVMRDKHWESMNQTGFKVLYAPQRAYPERTISISEDVEEELQEKITAAILSPEGQKAASKVLEVFKRKSFDVANPEEYEGLGEMLDPIWGFQLDR